MWRTSARTNAKVYAFTTNTYHHPTNKGGTSKSTCRTISLGADRCYRCVNCLLLVVSVVYVFVLQEPRARLLHGCWFLSPPPSPGTSSPSTYCITIRTTHHSLRSSSNLCLPCRDALIPVHVYPSTCTLSAPRSAPPAPCSAPHTAFPSSTRPSLPVSTP